MEPQLKAKKITDWILGWEKTFPKFHAKHIEPPKGFEGMYHDFEDENCKLIKPKKSMLNRCGKPHNNGEDEDESQCKECFILKHNI